VIFYAFQCARCDRSWDEWLRLEERDALVQCEHCGTAAKRRFAAPPLIGRAEAKARAQASGPLASKSGAPRSAMIGVHTDDSLFANFTMVNPEVGGFDSAFAVHSRSTFWRMNLQGFPTAFDAVNKPEMRVDRIQHSTGRSGREAEGEGPRKDKPMGDGKKQRRRRR
jgi:putative FmdB family regulatory protein